MARKLDRAQLREFAAFLEELAQLGDWQTDAEWSRKAGVHAVNLSEARTGKSQTDGYNLLKLIRATAERTGAPVADVALSASRAADPLAALEATLGEFAKASDVRAGFETLRAAIDRLATARTREAGPNRRGSAG